MNKFRFTIKILALATFMFAFASITQAQATRTWVSGVGDDVNPCSRTAPCKTFAGAISKTAVDGEINALDPAGFGAVTITKAITIDGGPTNSAGILASLTTAVIINIQVNSGSNTVQLRNISMNGAGNGINGIRVVGPGVANLAVLVERCVIWGFRATGAGQGRGITDERTAAGSLWVSDTMIKNNFGSGIVAIGNGGPTTTIENVQCVKNGATGMVASGTNRTMVIRNSVVSKNGGIGFGGELGAKMDIINSLSTQNATGIDSLTVGTEIRVSRTTVARNTTNGLGFAGGTILSYGNNEVSGNTGNNGPFSPAGPVLQ